jgi:hypothetical protein
MATRASCKKHAALLAGTLVLALVMGILAPAAQASPFVGVYMEARVAGGTWVSGSYNTTTKTWTMPVLAVTPGATIEYKLYTLWTGAVGMSNAKGTTSTTDDLVITSLTAGINGINSQKFNVYQNSADPVQVNFATTSALDGTSWNLLGTGSSGGIVTARTGATGYNNLVGVRPIATTGVYLGLVDVGGVATPTPVLISTGSATVGGVSGKADSTILMGHITPTTQTAPLTARINSPVVAVSESYLWTGGPTYDPATVYNGVTLYTPWAEAAINNIPAGGGFEVDPTIPGTTLTLNANVGGSSHTTVTYHWTINSGAPLLIDTEVPVLTLTNEQLNNLGKDGANHEILLSVHTGDGQVASLSTPVPLTLPEPATMVLLSVGGLIVAIRRRRAQ